MIRTAKIFHHVTLTLCLTALPAAARPAQEVFDDAMKWVAGKFHNPALLSNSFRQRLAEAREKLPADASDTRVTQVTNELLATLKTSHTAFYSDGDQDYWALRSIFSGDVDGASLRQGGAWFHHREGRWFVRSVPEGSPAAEAGWLPGDEVLAVDGRPLQPVRSFFPLDVVVQLRRKSVKAAFVTRLRTREESFQRTFLEATRRSFRFVDENGKRIAYFHLWCGTHARFKEALEEAANAARDARAHAFVLDLRDGFGGADPSFLDPFFRGDFAGRLVAITNGGTRSGKEWVAWTLREKKRALLVGERTAGYFLAATPFPVPPNFLLYLAVAKPKALPELEGNGVVPDIVVAGEEEEGRDPQLKAAIGVASR